VSVCSVSLVDPVVEVLDRRRVEPETVRVAPCLLEVLKTVPDPRDPRGTRYPLVGLLAIMILATAAGMRSVAGFASWVRTAPPEVLAELGIRVRRPSEKTLRTLIARLDAADLDRRLGDYFAAVAAVADSGGLMAVALDGKTVRGARLGGGRAPHLVSIFAHHARLVLGQLAVAAKSNEIPTVRKLLKGMNRTGLIATIDAMHTQVATAKLICGQLKSHYLMTVKANQPKLLARITAQPWGEVPIAHRDADAKPSHGRIETRTMKVLTVPRGIGFPYARQIMQITRERVQVTTGKRTIETVYAICSVSFEQAKPRQLAAWLRNHWGIENAVHWVRDVTYDEDRSTLRTGTAPQVAATLRNTAISLHRIDGALNIAEACRTTGFSPNRGLHLLTNTQNPCSQAS
jgi:predicted transposase YbfD/YdcC